MLSFLVMVMVILTINFREFSQQAEMKQAKIIASLVKDGLTAHMASGTMGQRKLFLDNAKKSSNAKEIWIFRTNKVVKLFGKGFRDETLRDSIDKEVIKTGKIKTTLKESLVSPELRITIPYIATSNSNPDCLSCHTNAKDGDVLGGITMVFDIESARVTSIITILKILAVSLVFIVLFIYVTNRFLKPYVGALIDIKELLKKASQGDYSSRIKTNGDGESAEAFVWLNALFEKLEQTICSIEKNISLFVADRRQKFSDPLEKAQYAIENIASIYRFKRTIEQDISKEVIYHRLIKIFKNELKISDISLYEVNIKKDVRVLIYDDTPEKFCEIADTQTSIRCRAYRTNSIVASDDFENICQVCKTDKEYLCINYQIDENISLIVNIKPQSKDELFENKKAIGYIKNYLESARPILQNKILTEILEKSNMIDGLTQIYNRKYLDIFMDTKIKNYKEYVLAMLDIDYFKKVNDSFGHDAGDVVLKGLSDIFKKNIGEDDIAFRFGGEEFLIFLPNPKNALSTIQKIKDDFENTTFNLNGKTLNKTLSAGLASYKNDSESPWQIIKFADIAMYEAKNSGRNRIVLYKDMEKDKTNLKNNGEF
ncbi:MAG: diguanylate cyclase [Sulfurospirillum sp.]